MNGQEVAFDKERTELIKSIQEIQDTPSVDAENLSRLRHYRTRYNNMMDSRVYLCSRVDPLVALPSDLWIDILSEALRRPNNNNYLTAFLDFHSTPALCTLLLVSKRWRSLIMEVPKLWSEIELSDEISDKGQDMLALLTIFLHFSASHHLLLHVYPPFGSWDLVRDRLAAHRHRIQEITFHPTILGFRNGNSILYDLLPLPKLTSIMVWEWTYIVY